MFQLKNKYLLIILIIVNEISFMVFPIYVLSPVKEGDFFKQFLLNVGVGYITAYIGILLILAIIDIFLWRAIKMTANNDSIKNSLNLVEAECDIVYNYYLESVEVMQKTRKFRHDFNNNMQAVSCLSNDDIADAQQILDSMKKTLDNISNELKETENAYSSTD